jgi:glucosyl-3-phosphoglycerate synthase
MNADRMKSRDSATLCIPAHNEASTIEQIVMNIRHSLVRRGDVQEILVVDDRSDDGTGEIAKSAGARVIRTEDWCALNGGSMGKGDAIWASIAACNTDLIGWVDGDLTHFDMHSLREMFVALRNDSQIQLIKGAFDRVNCEGEIVEGRLTALTARPLLGFFYPELALLDEPLGGIFALRTQEAAELSLDPDYGVDVGILIDVYEKFGAGAIREVGMGTLSHQSRPLGALADTAQMISRAILSRAVFTNPQTVLESKMEHLSLRRLPVSYFSLDDLARVS